jgi:hypothetical protein
LSASLEDPTATDLATTPDPPRAAVADAVARALAEDLLPIGDLTAALIPITAVASMHIVSRSEGVLAGRACAAETFAQLDPGLSVDWRLGDGDLLQPGAVVATVWGSLRSILTAERTVLNFLGHLSGVASLTRRYVAAVQSANPATRVLDTRKTTPGLRSLEKAAVRAGGGHNHRGSLSDAVLVKDNHRAASISPTRWPGQAAVAGPDGRSRVRPGQTRWPRPSPPGPPWSCSTTWSPTRWQCVALVGSTRASGTLVEVSGRLTWSPPRSWPRPAPTWSRWGLHPLGPRARSRVRSAGLRRKG